MSDVSLEEISSMKMDLSCMIPKLQKCHEICSSIVSQREESEKLTLVRNNDAMKYLDKCRKIKSRLVSDQSSVKNLQKKLALSEERVVSALSDFKLSQKRL